MLCIIWELGLIIYFVTYEGVGVLQNISHLAKFESGVSCYLKSITNRVGSFTNCYVMHGNALFSVNGNYGPSLTKIPPLRVRSNTQP